MLSDEQTDFIECVVGLITAARKYGFKGTEKAAVKLLNGYDIELEFTESGVIWKRKQGG
jgi:hypothetical protein